MIYLLTVKEILILSNKIYLFTKKYNHSRQLYSDTKLYSFQGTVSVHSRKYILVQRNIFIQGNYIHSRKYIYLTLEGIRGGGGGQSDPPLDFFGLKFLFLDRFLFVNTSFDPN